MKLILGIITFYYNILNLIINNYNLIFIIKFGFLILFLN